MVVGLVGLGDARIADFRGAGIGAARVREQGDVLLVVDGFQEGLVVVGIHRQDDRVVHLEGLVDLFQVVVKESTANTSKASTILPKVQSLKIPCLLFVNSTPR